MECNNCKKEMRLVAYIDNFGCLINNFKVPESIVGTWIEQGKSNEGYCYKCDNCGKYCYLSDEEHDIICDMMEGKIILEPISAELIEIENNLRLWNSPDILQLKKELGKEKAINFVEKNGKSCGKYKFLDDIYTYYKMRDCFTNKDIYIQVRRGYWHHDDYVKQLKI